MNKADKRARVLLLSVSFLLILTLLAAVLLLSRSRAGRQSSVLLIPAAEIHRAESLTLGSRWNGWLTISGHKGKGSLENGLYPIRGLIDASEGGSFFELYEEGDLEGSAPILSLWVRLDYKTMVPLIGEQDARYFDIWLDERDVEAFTLTLEEGTLAQSYDYNDGSESCRIEFRIKQEK